MLRTAPKPRGQRTPPYHLQDGATISNSIKKPLQMTWTYITQPYRDPNEQNDGYLIHTEEKGETLLLYQDAKRYSRKLTTLTELGNLRKTELRGGSCIKDRKQE